MLFNNPRNKEEMKLKFKIINGILMQIFFTRLRKIEELDETK